MKREPVMKLPSISIDVTIQNHIVIKLKNIFR